jgi:hypothetical protein
MSATGQFWLTFYVVCGIATWLFMTLNYEFLEDTPWWRKIFSSVFVVALWPVILFILMFT